MDFGELWNTSNAVPKCGFNPLDVRFGPILDCDDNQFVDDSCLIHGCNFSCQVLSNPLVPLRNISWVVFGRDHAPVEETKKLWIQKVNHGLLVVFKVGGREGTFEDKFLAGEEFSDGSTHLYMRVCPSVGWSVGPSVGP